MGKNEDVISQQERLLGAVSEQLKQPLLFIRGEAEFAMQNGDRQSLLEDIHASAHAGLMFVEHFLVWQRQATSNQIYPEQISLSAVLCDVSAHLHDIAKKRQTTLRLEMNGRYAPVITDQKVLSAALSALGLAFIEAADDSDANEVVFSMHKSRWGIITGVYSPQLSIRADAFVSYKKLIGSARQLFPTTSHTTMSGVAVADALFSQLSVQLRTSRHKHMDGLAVTLSPSPQLALL